MRLLVDTNRYRDFCANDQEAVDRFQMADQIFLPFVTLAELKAGFLCGTMAKRNEAGLVRFLNNPRVSLLFASEDTCDHYSRLYLQLRQQGTPIPTNDLWIAALASEHNLVLYSRDVHFDHLPQLSRA